MRERNGKSLRFTLAKPRYGAVEINYDSPRLPRFTAYVLMDPLLDVPADALWLSPGSHEVIEYGPDKTIAFRAGVHRLPGDRLRPVSNCNIYLAPGAVPKCGILLNIRKSASP